MKLFTVSTLALGLTFSAWAEDTSRNDELLNSINQETIRFVSESLDHSIQRNLDEDIGVLANYTDEAGGTELVYAMQGRACQDGPDCLGLEIFVIYNGDFSIEQANDINQRWAAIKARVADGDLYLTRYLILDDGQTLGNVRTNLRNTLAIAEQIGAEQNQADETTHDEQISVAEIDFGEDAGSYANDGACDDARFESDGDLWDYQRNHVLRDATDCRELYAAGELILYLDFGDNSGEYANDGTCDDNRFTGEGRSILETDSHVKRDAVDCIVAYRAGTIDRP